MEQRIERMHYAMIILWPAFLIAALAEFVLFAAVDPAAIHVPWFDTGSRPAAYTIGFFAFWLLGALSSALSLFLLGGPGPAHDASIAPELDRARD
jgi:hypothetical protein